MTATEPVQPLLSVRGLIGGYDGTRVLDGVDLDVPHGETVALLGRNGVGKTTLVMALMGFVPSSAGSAVFDGTELAGARPERIARLGIGLVPQGRRVFAALTVDEHLRISAPRRGPRSSARGPRGSRGWGPDEVYELFPALARRRKHRGDRLSGGEQEMLAIGRALLTEPRLLLLDEPSDGLAPAVVDQVGEVVERLVAEGVSVLLVEQNVALARRLAGRVAVMTKGRITYTAGAAEVTEERLPELLGVT